MMNFSRRSAKLFLCTGLLLWTAAILYANWENDYRKGMKSLKKRDYGEALEYFQAAVSSKPDDCSDCMREGMHFYNYLPNYYIGECFYKLGYINRAKVFYDKSEEMGAVKTDQKLYSTLQKRLDEINRAAVPPPAVEPQQQTQPAPMLPPRPGPEVIQLRNQLKQRLAASAEKLSLYESLVRNRPALKTILQKARLKVLSLQDDLLKAEQMTGLRAIETELDTLVETLADLQKRIESQPAPGQDKPVRDKPPVTDTPKKPEPKTSPPVEKPGKEGLDLIKQGFMAFFNGNLPSAEAYVKRAEESSAKSCFADLLRGCILYSRYLMGEKTDEDLLSPAKDAFTSAQRKGCSPDLLTEKDFSPRLVSFYRETASK